jgi:hypothetical protein
VSAATAVVMAEGFGLTVLRSTGLEELWLNPAVFRIEGLSARGSNCGAIFDAANGFDLSASAARAEKKPTGASSGILGSVMGEPPGGLFVESFIALLFVVGLGPSGLLFDGAGRGGSWLDLCCGRFGFSC